MPRKIAKGRQGDWFATTRAGEELPCLKREHRHGLNGYHDPYAYDLACDKDAAYLEAVRRGRVLIATYEDGRRTGYLNYVFLVTDVQHDAGGLRCRVIGREQP